MPSTGSPRAKCARLIIDTAHEAFVGMDEAGRIVGWNAQAEATFGGTRDEALGRNLADTIIPASFREAHTLGMRRFLETGDAPVVNRRLELAALDRSGREFPAEITITAPIHVGGGFTDAFAAGREPEDDQTLLLLKIQNRTPSVAPNVRGRPGSPM